MYQPIEPPEAPPTKAELLQTADEIGRMADKIDEYDLDLIGVETGCALIELLDELESVLKIQCAPVTWPIGMGKNFRGVYHIIKDEVLLFTPGNERADQEVEVIKGIDNGNRCPIAVGRDPAPLATEALRGEGAILRDADGVAFMAAVHPLADLAPRDVVARAITRRLVERNLAHLFLDATPIADFAARFPTVDGAARAAGLPTRLHTDQFTSLGGAEMAIEEGARESMKADRCVVAGSPQALFQVKPDWMLSLTRSVRLAPSFQPDHHQPIWFNCTSASSNVLPTSS